MHKTQKSGMDSSTANTKRSALNRNIKKNIVKTFFLQLLLIDFIRYCISRIRFFYFVTLRRKLKTFSQDANDASQNTIMHNLKGLGDLAVVRSLALIRPLSVIEKLNSNSKILTLGPRTEGELLSIIAHGFSSKNVRGLDLISYSPWIDLGDMHNMPYEDSTWDAVIMGWILAYSENPQKAADEVIRVSKPGGLIAVGVEYCTLSKDQIKESLGYVPGAQKRIESVNEILSFFGESVDHVYFSSELSTEELQETDVADICVIFSIKK